MVYYGAWPGWVVSISVLPLTERLETIFRLDWKGMGSGEVRGRDSKFIVFKCQFKNKNKLFREEISLEEVNNEVVLCSKQMINLKAWS